MQKLIIKRRNEKTGAEENHEVRVVRSWHSATGSTIYLHANGVYGYKDGSPVVSAGELSIVGGPHSVQYRAAMAWWRNRGEKLSSDFYAAREQMEQERNADFVDIPDGDNSVLDVIMYRRRAIKKGAAMSDPKSWMELGFSERPGWWGQARMIEVGNHLYELAEADEEQHSKTEASDDVGAGGSA